MTSRNVLYKKVNKLNKILPEMNASLFFYSTCKDVMLQGSSGTIIADQTYTNVFYEIERLIYLFGKCQDLMAELEKHGVIVDVKYYSNDRFELSINGVKYNLDPSVLTQCSSGEKYGTPDKLERIIPILEGYLLRVVYWH